MHLKNTTKKQHFVPQFLLRNFCQEKKNRIFVFDKKLNHSFPSNVNDIGHENSFYDERILGYENGTEFILSELEAIIAPIIDKIVTHGSIKALEDGEHKYLCLFSTIQMLRTNETREFLEDSNQILAERIKELGYNPNTDVENFKEASKEELKSSAIDILNRINRMPGELVGRFLDKQLTLLQAPEGQSFYISDNPIVKHNHLPREGRGNLGIGLKGIEIFFPISSSYCLSFLCSELAEEIKQNVKNFKTAKLLGIAPQIDINEAEKMVNNFERRTTNKLNELNMDFCNSLQVIESTRFVYSGCSKFLLAKNMLKTNPEISNQAKVVDGSKVF